jgi:hypothetical protein
MTLNSIFLVISFNECTLYTWCTERTSVTIPVKRKQISWTDLIYTYKGGGEGGGGRKQPKSTLKMGVFKTHLYNLWITNITR